MKLKNIVLGAVGVIVALGVIGAVSKKGSAINAGVTPAVAANHGYSLKPKEAALLDFLLRDDAKSFADGADSLLTGDGMLSVSAIQVAKDYEANQVSADQKYYKKRLRVSGNILNINSGIGNEPYLVLRGANELLGPQVHFENNDGTVQKVAKLTRGQQVHIVCDGGGAVVGTPMFRRCTFADDYANQKIQDQRKYIVDFLSGENPKSKNVAMVAILAVAGARALPDNSACFNGGDKCAAEFGAAQKSGALEKTFPAVVEELKSDGVQVPAKDKKPQP